jgi:hypothetical protein
MVCPFSENRGLKNIFVREQTGVEQCSQELLSKQDHPCNIDGANTIKTLASVALFILSIALNDSSVKKRFTLQGPLLSETLARSGIMHTRTFKFRSGLFHGFSQKVFFFFFSFFFSLLV